MISKKHGILLFESNPNSVELKLECFRVEWMQVDYHTEIYGSAYIATLVRRQIVEQLVRKLCLFSIYSAVVFVRNKFCK